MKLYISNLPAQIMEKELKKLFQVHGEVASTVVIKNRKTGMSKGYGFVVMHDRIEAEAAISGLNGKKLNEQIITVAKVLPTTKPKSSIETNPDSDKLLEARFKKKKKVKSNLKTKPHGHDSRPPEILDRKDRRSSEKDKRPTEKKGSDDSSSKEQQVERVVSGYRKKENKSNKGFRKKNDGCDL